MPTLDQVFAAAMQLSEEDRVKLAALLLEVIPDEPDVDVEEAWREEVRRRRAAWKAGRVQAVPIEEGLARIFAKP
jgi:putative addiction module component (TIGR02574 family)